MPLVGVAVLGWSVFEILVLYWLENVVVGVLNLFRMAWSRGDDGPMGCAMKAIMMPFFVVHYGMFTFVHGIFVGAIFGGPSTTNIGPFELGWVWPVIAQHHLWFAVAALVLSHGVSFVANYLGEGEYRRTTMQQLMTRPYTRIVVLHLVIILGGFVVMALGAPIAALVLLVGLKLGIDLAAHAREHKRMGAATAA